MLAWVVIVPILISVFLYALPFEKAGKIIAVIVQTVLTGCTFFIFLLCKEGDIVTKIGNYPGVLGITLKADTLSSVFIILTSFVFLITALYSFHEDLGKFFWFLLFIWEGLLLGVFMSCDLFNIFVLLEVITVAASIMIMFNHDNRSMYDGIVYLMANIVAVQFYLFGIGYIYKLTGVLDRDAAAEAVRTLGRPSLALPYALIMTSVSLKCALMPLFSWLPKAHGTPGVPPAVSAILSGLHIKSGVYLFMRFQAVFQEITPHDFFLAAGIITGIAGFILAIAQTDIKLILAYHTISQIGMIMIGLNASGIHPYAGGVYHIINHAVFKSGLFLSAGIIIRAYGTRDIRQIRGVLRRIPAVGTATIMAVLGITGAPFFNGSVSKYFIMSGAHWAVSAAVMFINLGTIVSFIKYSAMLFGRHEGSQSAQGGRVAVKVDACRQAAVLILGFFCLAGGVFGQQLIKFLFNINVSVDAAGYLQKTVFFAFSAAAGYFIFKYYIRTSKLFKRIRGIELGFRGICVLIGMFFALILVWCGWAAG
jgi:multicomponent Na+:H+ antiporter subunit D